MTKEIAEKLGVELEAIQTAFEGYKVMSNDDFDSFKTNLSKVDDDVKEKYQSEGRQVGKELLLKELKGQLGLEYEGRKSTENFVTAISEKFAKADSSEYAEKLAELGKDKSKVEKDFELYREDVANKESLRFIGDSLTKEFNEYAGKTTLGADDLMTLYKSKNNVKYDGDSLKIYKGDSVLKDDMMNPLTVKDSIKNFVESSYLTTPMAQGGRAGGDDTGLGGSKMSIDKYSEKLQKQGIAVGSEAHSKMIVESINNGTIE